MDYFCVFQEFHEEVTSKNSDAERLTKLVSLENKQKYGRSVL